MLPSVQQRHRPQNVPLVTRISFTHISSFIRRVLRIPKLPPPSPAVLLDLDATVARGARLQQVPPSASLKPGNLAWYSALVAHHYQYRVVRLNGLAFALRDYDPQCDKSGKSPVQVEFAFKCAPCVNRKGGLWLPYWASLTVL